MAGDGATVSLTGAVGAQGVYPIERPTRTLADAAGRAVLRSTRCAGFRHVRVRPARSGLRISTIIPSSIFRCATAIRSSLRVTPVRSPHWGPPPRRPACRPEPLRARGHRAGRWIDCHRLRSNNVFVFRNEPGDLNQVLGRDDLVGAQRMIYVLNLPSQRSVHRPDFVIRR